MFLNIHYKATLNTESGVCYIRLLLCSAFYTFVDYNVYKYTCSFMASFSIQMKRDGNIKDQDDLVMF